MKAIIELTSNFYQKGNKKNWVTHTMYFKQIIESNQLTTLKYWLKKELDLND